MPTTAVFISFSDLTVASPYRRSKAATGGRPARAACRLEVPPSRLVMVLPETAAVQDSESSRTADPSEAMGTGMTIGGVLGRWEEATGSRDVSRARSTPSGSREAGGLYWRSKYMPSLHSAPRRGGMPSRPCAAAGKCETCGGQRERAGRQGEEEFGASEGEGKNGRCWVYHEMCGCAAHLDVGVEALERGECF